MRWPGEVTENLEHQRGERKAESSLVWARWNAPDEHKTGTPLFLSTASIVLRKPPLPAKGCLTLWDINRSGTAIILLLPPPSQRNLWRRFFYLPSPWGEGAAWPYGRGGWGVYAVKRRFCRATPHQSFAFGKIQLPLKGKPLERR